MNKKEAGSLRAKRKDEHIHYFLDSCPKSDNGFGDVVLQNNALPELGLEDIRIEGVFAGKKLGAPVLINAMTGGTHYTQKINEKLAALAKEYNLAIAVGSQTIALNDKERESSFRVIRDIHSEGVVIANLSANCKYEDAVKAMEMIDADALQLHLNIAQELCMKEGDRNFKGLMKNISQLTAKINKPVIVKEVGFGISFQTAEKLFDSGVRYIDIGGKGGTNFVEIENARNSERDFAFLKNWGIKTALSLLECRNVSNDLHLVCTGGISSAEEIVKALCMGADLVGISGSLLRVLLSEDYETAEKMIGDRLYEMKVLMLLLGCKDIQELRKVQYLLKGETRELWQYKFV